jgi:hypothetical protein
MVVELTMSGFSKRNKSYSEEFLSIGKVFLLKITKDLSTKTHKFLCCEPEDAGEEWLDKLAETYLILRSSTHSPLNPIIYDGLSLDVTELRRKIETANLPDFHGGIFDVVRSDFGEVWSYVVMESDFATRFGYKSVRDRETIQLPGRGIDGIGVEYNLNKLTLILLETKVSDEVVSPPQVVDIAKDSLRNQHLDHLNNRKKTYKKILDCGRRSWEEDTRDLLFAAAVYFEREAWDKMDLICSCFLVRSSKVYKTTDFGTFQTSTEDYLPAKIRFIVMCTPKTVDEMVKLWHTKTIQKIGVQ